MRKVFCFFLPASLILMFSIKSKAQNQPGMQNQMLHATNIKYENMKWAKLQPELGGFSAEITVLHVDPVTNATQLIIRMPGYFHVPKHWHTANETHTVVSGVFVMECEGVRDTLKAGGFNFMPAKMHHEAWALEPSVIFITVDKAWDINWVGGTPKPEDYRMKKN